MRSYPKTLIKHEVLSEQAHKTFDFCECWRAEVHKTIDFCECLSVGAPKEQTHFAKTLEFLVKIWRNTGPEHTSKLAPGSPSGQKHTPHTPTQLRLARSHARHETKTKTKRSRSPAMGGWHKAELAPPRLRPVRSRGISCSNPVHTKKINQKPHSTITSQAQVLLPRE